MNHMIEKKIYIQRLYARYSGFIDRIFKFVTGLILFAYINENMGLDKTIANPIIVVVLSLLCAFVPTGAMVFLAIIYTLVMLFSLSSGIAAVALLVLILMYIFCFRMAPKQSLILVLMPIAFILKIPMFVPIACGLLYTPAVILPMVCGVLFYYMISYTETYTAIIEKAEELGVMGQVTTYIQQYLGSMEMWMAVLAFIVCMVVVYNIRRTSIENAWEIAAISGSIINMIVLLFISLDSGSNLSPVWIIIGTVISGVLGILMEFFAFSLDYSRTENLQFEDDEYYYYVKAVPKITVAEPKKTVKKINTRQNTSTMNAKAQKRRTDEIPLDNQFPDDLDLQRLLEEELNK